MINVEVFTPYQLTIQKQLIASYQSQNLKTTQI